MTTSQRAGEIEALLTSLQSKLSNDDDPAFWRELLAVLLSRLDERSACAPELPCFLQIGASSHWIRPHQARWTAGGGFAWPAGYGAGGMSYLTPPEFDWSAIFARIDGEWKPAAKFTGKKRLGLRVSVPSRTARHEQAVLHTSWSPGREIEFFGFRKRDGEWTCLANRIMNSESESTEKKK